MTGTEGLVGREHALATTSAALDAAVASRGRALLVAGEASIGKTALATALLAGERTRKAVTARIRNAVARIERAHPPLGAHFRASVRTGLWCRYVDTATRWNAEPVAAGQR